MKLEVANGGVARDSASIAGDNSLDFALAEELDRAIGGSENDLSPQIDPRRLQLSRRPRGVNTSETSVGRLTLGGTGGHHHLLTPHRNSALTDPGDHGRSGIDPDHLLTVAGIEGDHVAGAGLGCGEPCRSLADDDDIGHLGDGEDSMLTTRVRERRGNSHRLGKNDQSLLDALI